MPHALSLLRGSACIPLATFGSSRCPLPLQASAVRHFFSMRQRAFSCFKASPLLTPSPSRFLSTGTRIPVSSTVTPPCDATSQATEKLLGDERNPKPATTDDNAEEDDDMKIHIYRPQASPEVADRKAKTELFLCLLLTLPRTQDWKDMLTAAFRAGTWRPRHLDAVLRGVLLNKYNAPRAFLRSVGSSSAAVSANDALREAALQASRASPATSTPTSRLHRARDILVFCAEEGPLYGKGDDASVGIEETHTEAPLPSSAAPSVGDCGETLMRSDAVAPSPAAVHHLLTMLLQAAQRGGECGSPSSSAHPASASAPPSTSAGEPVLPVASYTDVWHYLSWMELHGYHVLSYAVLDALEAVVDDVGSLPRPPSHRNTSNSSAESATSSSPSAALGPLRYASVSQRIHRLGYLQGERTLLQESLRSPSRMGGDPGRSVNSNHASYRRQPDMPRTDPAL